VPSAYEAVFLEDIRASPENDTPRLIYADWLEDNGDPDRAEFIRLQIGLARAAPDEPDLNERRRRERELLRQHGPVWRRSMPPWLRGCCVFRRGFLDEFDGSAGTFFRDEIADFLDLAPSPILRLAGVNPSQIRALRNTPHIARLRGLYLSNPKTSAELLVDSLRLDKAVRLSELGLVRVRGAWSIRALLYDGWTRRLKRLTLVGCGLDDDCLDFLLGWPGLRTLESLDLRENQFSPDAVVRIHSALKGRVRLG
jgi:uncharacterized protein (TIGR02996 family)